MLESVLPKVPCRHWTVSFPKRIRVFFRYDPTLRKALSAIVYDVLQQFYRTVTGREDIRIAMVVHDQSFGTVLGHHPHHHLISSDGGYAPDGSFVGFKRINKRIAKELTEVIRRRVLLLLQRRGKIDSATRESLLGWEHSGFSLHPSRRVPAHRRDRLEKLLFYIARHPFSQEDITYNRETGHVIYRAPKMGKGGKQNFEVFHGPDFLAALADHIPHARRHTVRYYGAATPKLRHELIGADTPMTVRAAVPQGKGLKSWRRLIYKVYGVDPLICDCGAPMSLVSIIFNDGSLIRILRSLGQPTHLPARAPPAKTGVTAGANEISEEPCDDCSYQPYYDDTCDPIYDYDFDQRVPETNDITVW